MNRLIPTTVRETIINIKKSLDSEYKENDYYVCKSEGFVSLSMSSHGMALG